MKNLFILYLVFTVNLVWSNNDVETLRKVFAIASKDVNKAKALYAYFEKKKNISGPTELAYKGATIALMAKFATNPYTKLKHVNKALEIINDAVKKEPENFEIRFLRFSIEKNLPAILNSSKNIEADLKLIFSYLNKKDHWTSFETDVAKDIISSNCLPDYQQTLLTNHLNKKNNE